MPYQDLGSAEARYGVLPSEGVVALSSSMLTPLNCCLGIWVTMSNVTFPYGRYVTTDKFLPFDTDFLRSWHRQ